LTDADELKHLRESLKELREDISTMKDNHLAHMERDMSLMRTHIAVIKTRLDPVEKFVESWNQKMMLIFLGAVSASIGIPMML
tara:strand:+ start:8440 stop:8688 length:249 start_codon:yes stop_codon:yes gene_type:complete